MRWQRAPALALHWARAASMTRSRRLGAWRGVVLVKLEGEVRLCALVDVELGDEVDLHPAYLACTVGHAVHELAEGPAEVLEAQEDGRADEVGGAVSFRRSFPL
jgi:hypothetical protein